MEIKENIGEIAFCATAKKYVLNMMKKTKKNGTYTLHIKCTSSCQWSKGLAPFTDFDTLEEAQQCGLPIRYCKKCFPELSD